MRRDVKFSVGVAEIQERKERETDKFEIILIIQYWCCRNTRKRKREKLTSLINFGNNTAEMLPPWPTKLLKNCCHVSTINFHVKEKLSTLSSNKVFLEYHKCVFLPLTCMVGFIMNLISGTHHSYERREYTFMILGEYTIISRSNKQTVA